VVFYCRIVTKPSSVVGFTAGYGRWIVTKPSSVVGFTAGYGRWIVTKPSSVVGILGDEHLLYII
jgi:hypothetical protein